ncbi:hypothetical protein CPB84DRAFT_1843385 [Gymnopilus junonius]|uniref:Uncharacterized protein n=1 Tax=Gymnopilus junonius TaxID=109634 RepID=A0A9P5TRB9_GYMJU|nr:hypothetical protein CPB84DRAFT_1843385 [Gymnopilus junonius]
MKLDWIEGLEGDLMAVESLDTAMKFWSAENIVNTLKAVSFSINWCRIRGAVRGSQDAKSFMERTWIYFPANNGVFPPRGSKWIPFFAERVGYIKRFHKMLEGMGGEDGERNIREGLEDIFGELQCLPDSESFTETKEGKTWCRAAGEDAISILVNVRHMWFRQIGRTVEVRDGPRRSHVTRSVKDVMMELFKLHGLVEEVKQVQQRRWRVKRKSELKKKSIQVKNKRVAPKRKHVENSDQDDDESESSTDSFSE